MKKVRILVLAVLMLLVSLIQVHAYSYAKEHYTYQITGYEDAIESGMDYRTKADRQYTGDTIRIKDHVVYQRSDAVSQPNEPLYYTVIDYFDSDEAERNATSIRIRNTIDGLPVKEISVFYRDAKKRALVPNKEDCLPQITRLTIPDSVAVISDYSLSYFSSLKTLRLPKGLRVLGVGACYGMDALEKLSIPAGVERIGAYAFYHCPRLKKVTCKGNELSVIDNRAFAKCTALPSVTLPASLQFVEDSAFLGCSSLKKVYLQFKTPAVLYGSDSSFLHALPDDCAVFVSTKAMKNAAKQMGCNGVVKVKVPVNTPKKLTMKAKGASLLLQWSKVAGADGYRVYQFDEKNQSYKKIKTLHGSNTRSLRLKGVHGSFAVRAFRVVDGDVSWSAYRMTTA